MIDDNVFPVGAAKGIITPITVHHTTSLVFIAHTKTEVADNNIIARQYHGVIGKANAVAGSCLSRYGHIAADVYFGVQVNSAGYRKYNNSFFSFLSSLAKTARAIIVEGGNNICFSPAAAGSIFSKTLSAGKGNSFFIVVPTFYYRLLGTA